MRTSEQIKAEIKEQFGFVPPFFEPATETPEVLENLWQQTMTAYINNPLPALFKEKLFAYLSRYCSVPYCIICHSCALRPLGMTGKQVLTLLQEPPPNMPGELKVKPLVSSTQIEPLTDWPAANSALEISLYRYGILIYLKPAIAQQYRNEWLRILGSFYYNHLIAFIAYVKTCHQWGECHPELVYEADQRVQLHLAALLQQAPALGDFFANYNEKVKREYQKQEAELQQSNSILQAVIEGTTDAIFLKDSQGRYLMVNSTKARLLGKSVEEIIGKDDTQLLSPGEADQVIETDRRVIATGISEIVEEVLTINEADKTLAMRTYLVTKDVCRDRVGNTIGLIGIARDITPRKRLEKERSHLLEVQQQLIGRLQQQTIDLVALSAVGTTAISTLNLQQLLDVLLQCILQVVGADAAMILLKEDNQLRVSAGIGIQKPIPIGFLVPMEQGFAGTIAATRQPLYIEDAQTDSRVINQALKQMGIRSMLGVPLQHNNELVGVLHVDWFSIHPFSSREVYLLEIAAERSCMAILNAQLFEQTKQLQQRQKLQIDTMPIGYMVCDRFFHLTDWNPAASNIFGFTKEEVLGKHPQDLIVPPAAKVQIEEIFQRLSQGDMTAPSVNENITKDGRTIICEWYTTPLKNPDGTIIGFQGMVKDITSRKIAEAELQQAHQRLKFHVENTPLALIEWDSQFRIKIWSQQAERIFGWKAEEVIGKSWQEWRYVYEEDIENIRAACDRLLDGSTPRNISRNRNYTKDGRIIHCEWYNSTLLDASGNLVSLLSLVLDVTARQQAEEALGASEQRFRSLIENATDMIVVIDSGGVCRYVSPSVERILGYRQEEIIDKFCSEFIEPEDVPLLSQTLDRAIQNPRVSQKMIDYRVRHKDGSWRIFEAVTTNLLDDPAVLGVAINCRDITERKIAEAALKQSDRKYYTLTKVAPVGIFHADAVGECLYVNERWCEISGLSLEESVGEGWVKALHPSDRQRIFQQWYQAVSENLPFRSEFRLQRGDGEISWVFAQAIAETGNNGEIIGYVGTLTDITERKQVEEQLRYYAFYDPLTSLPNRALLLNHLRKLLAHKPHPPSFAVLFLEMNRFQVIKYSLGHLFADQLIIATGERLQTCLNNFADPMWDFESADNDRVVELNKPLKIPNLKFTLSRLGLDEFAILLTGFQTLNDATTIADCIYQQLQLPFNLDGREVFVTASIGIAPSSINYDRAEDFLRAADTAVHHAKQLGKAGGYVVFEPQWHAGALERLQLETDLRWAIERQQLRVYYQPIVSLKNNRISGFEALVRWQHPTRGIVSPVEFIPLAEETGLIGLIDRWVLREACRQVAMWQEAFPSLAPLTLSVNLSGIELSQLGLIERIDQILRESGVRRRTLKLEITESKLTGNTSFEIGILQQLKALGIQLSIDDFGTGYSCLARLHQMPIDTLKIDRSFVSQMSVDSESLEIVRTIITLAHSLGMDAIAEGVESEFQMEQLVELECEYGQGYFFSKPIDSTSVWALLSANC